MHIGFFADAHVGNHRRFGGQMVAGINSRCRMVLETLVTARENFLRSLVLPPFPDSHHETMIVSLGDLFDTDSPTPQILTATRQALAGGVFLLMGNHEMTSTAEGDHALGPLDNWGTSTVMARPDVYSDWGCDFWAVPFQPGEAHGWLPRVLERLETQEAFNVLGEAVDGKERSRVMALHLGVADEKTPAWLRGAHDSIDVQLLFQLMEEHDIHAVFTGNWHNHKVWEKDGRTVVQVGTLCPTGFDNEGTNYGYVATYDTVKHQIGHLQIPGPRFLKTSVAEGGLEDILALDAEERLHGAAIEKCKLFLEIACPATMEQQVRERATSMQEQGLLAGFDVVPDTAQDEASARTAAMRAKSADTTDEAFSVFIDAMPLPEGIDRATVLAEAKKYWARAG